MKQMKPDYSKTEKIIKRLAEELGINGGCQLRKNKFYAWMRLIPYRQLVYPLIINDFYQGGLTISQLVIKYSLTKSQIEYTLNKFNGKV